jgi:hypothetical protein
VRSKLLDINRILKFFGGPLGTIFTRQMLLISSRTASGPSSVIVGIAAHDQSRLHLEFPELVAAAEPSVRLSFVATKTQLYSMQTHRQGVVQWSKWDAVRCSIQYANK